MLSALWSSERHKTQCSNLEFDGQTHSGSVKLQLWNYCQKGHFSPESPSPLGDGTLPDAITSLVKALKRWLRLSPHFLFSVTTPIPSTLFLYQFSVPSTSAGSPER